MPLSPKHLQCRTAASDRSKTAALALIDNRKDLVEGFDNEIRVRIRDAEWRFDPDGVGGHAATADEQAAVFAKFHRALDVLRCDFLRFLVFHDFQAAHETLAAVFADDLVVPTQLVEAGGQPVALDLGVVHVIIALDTFDDREARRHRYGVAAIGIEVDLLAHGFGDFLCARYAAERDAVAHALGHRDHVGFHTPMLNTPPLVARAAEARLHFIGDEHAAVFLDDVVGDFKILLRGIDHAAKSLDRFRDERGDLAGRVVLDDVLEFARAGDIARGILQAKRAAVAIARRNVGDPEHVRH